MNASSDAAEQIVRLSIDGVEAVAKISGKGALELAKLLLSEMKAPQRTKGRASLHTMLKSKKPIKVFEIDDKSLKKFCEEAKKYGVLYHVLKDKSKNNGKCDIMVRAEDVSKINRIYERFGLGINQKASIRSNIVKSKNETKQVPEKTNPQKSEVDKFIDELFSKPNQKEKTEAENPSQAKTEDVRPSERISKDRQQERFSTSQSNNRPSIKKQLEDIKREQKKENTKTKTPQHTQPQKNNKPKRRNQNGRNR